MTQLARLERDALCDTFLAHGPQAPTLCSPWTAADLAAHIVIRDRRPDLAPGIWLSPLAGRLEKGQAQYAAKPWPELVELVRAGPPTWSPARLPAIDDTVNFVELFIHHEDVLRGDETPGPRRELSTRQSRAVWKTLGRTARLLFRRSPVGVVLQTPEGEELPARAATELGTVLLQGRPEELLLAAYGRRRVAALEETGGSDLVKALWTSPVGLS
ncbi:TIGR03085 family metal-binding protein [Pedococcus sp. 5OH_020]|uniref:TIGR03085 family metal-binding protein n=1 Tax=Pedococcus sp. 5OH_020 TaxID=2989814 RepID=UPI0022E99C11|nr:TIGR03085 family metal-binding protein [Pedococcus sp. 5OH_020]